MVAQYDAAQREPGSYRMAAWCHFLYAAFQVPITPPCQPSVLHLALSRGARTVTASLNSHSPGSGEDGCRERRVVAVAVAVAVAPQSSPAV